MKKLIDLKNWNRFHQFKDEQDINVPNGIACPGCGEELVDVDRSMILCSNPPQYSVICPKCSYRGNRYC